MVEVTQSISRIKGDRSCRDILFLIVFGAFWVGMLYCAGVGFSEGDPWALVFGLDYKGNVCGKDNGDPGNMNLEDFKYRYWPNVNEVFEAFTLNGVKSMCLDECPSPGNGTIKWVCNYPADSDPMNRSLAEWAAIKYDYFNDLSDEQKASSLQLNGPCYPILLKSTSIYWSCQYTGGFAEGAEEAWSEMGGKTLVNDDNGDIEESINDYLSDPVKVIERYVADLGEAWEVIVVCGLVCPLLFSFLWLILMRFCAGCFTWMVVILVNLMAIALALFTYVKAGVIGDDAITAVAGEQNVDMVETKSGMELDASETNKDALLAVAVVLTVVAVGIFLFTISMIKRINIAINILKVASQAVVANPTVLLVPIITFLWMCCLVVYWVFVAIFLYSSGDIVERDCQQDLLVYTDNCGYETDLDTNLKYMLVYHFFGLLWTMYFIIAFGQTVIAGVIAQYYWTRGSTNALTSSPVLGSFYRVVRYHLGSIAIGSFLVALLEMIRVIMVYVEKKCKEAAERSGNDALQAFVKCFFCFLQSCLACLKWILQFINRHAYIVIAIDGTSYCTSCQRAVKMLVNNVLRVAAVNLVGDSLLFLGKLAIAFGCGVITYLYLDSPDYKEGDKAVSSPLFVVTLVFLASYAVGSLFMSVVEMAVDTVLLSFCIDCDENNGQAVHGPPILAEVLDEAEKQEKARSGNENPPNST